MIKNENNATKFEKYTGEVAAAFEAGFLSEAARKRALDMINRAYEIITRDIQDEQLAYFHAMPHDEIGRRLVPEAEQANYDRVTALYYNMPALHVVKDKHFEAYAEYPVFTMVRDLVALRAAVKAAEIVKIERSAQEAKVEAVRKTIMEEMEMRKEQFVSGLNIARMFNGLPVHVNAHWVHGHKGAKFIRHFFYFAGRLTPLNMIIAISETYEAEKEGKK